MDPTRHGYFYDRHTQEPVEHADEVLQVGPLVLAKHPVYGDKSKYKYARGGDVMGGVSKSPLIPSFEKGLKNIPREKGTAAEFYRDAASQPGIKSQELQDRDLQSAYSDDTQKINKQQAMDLAATKPLQRLSVKTLPKYEGESFGEHESEEPPHGYAKWNNTGLHMHGGTDYREKLYVDPTIKEDTSDHWGGYGGVISHARIQDRELPEGGKALHIEELQSDPHQRAHSEGYRPARYRPDSVLSIVEPHLNEIADKAVETLSNYLSTKGVENSKEMAKRNVQEAVNYARSENERGDPKTILHRYAVGTSKLSNMAYPTDNLYAPKEYAHLNDYAPTDQGELWDNKNKRLHFTNKYKNDVLENWTYASHNLPFKSNWHEMTMKHLLHDAANEGHKSLLITPGTVQANRAHKEVPEIHELEYAPNYNEGDGFSVVAKDKNGVIKKEEALKDKNAVIQTYGKEAARRMQNREGEELRNGARRIKLDEPALIGGEFHRNLYDKKIPQFLNSIGKKHGTQVRTEMIPMPASGTEAGRLAQDLEEEFANKHLIKYLDTPGGRLTVPDAVHKYLGTSAHANVGRLLPPYHYNSTPSTIPNANKYVREELFPTLRLFSEVSPENRNKFSVIEPKEHDPKEAYELSNIVNLLRGYASGTYTWSELKKGYNKLNPVFYKDILERMKSGKMLHRFDIPESLRKQILEEGLPMYSRGGEVESTHQIKKAGGGEVDDINQPQDDSNLPEDDGTPARQLNNYGLYSHAAEVADSLPQDKGTPQQMISMLSKRGVKPDELYWSGVHKAFKDRNSVTKQELADHFRQNLPKLSESKYNKFSRFTPEWFGKKSRAILNTPLNNYRDIVTTANIRDLHAQYYDPKNPIDLWQNQALVPDYNKDIHWPDYNQISHIRLSDRETTPPKPRLVPIPKSDKTFQRQDGENVAGWSTGVNGLSVVDAGFSRVKNNKKTKMYNLIHDASKKSVQRELEFHHAMSMAKGLGELTDWTVGEDEIKNYFKDNQDDLNKILYAKAPPAPTITPKKSKPFVKEKILKVDESQSDLGQDTHKYSSQIEKLNSYKKQLDNGEIGAEEFGNLVHRLTKRSVTDYDHVADENGQYRPVTLYNDRKFNNLIQDKKSDLGNLLRSPYVDTTSKWTDLNVKRILTEAARGGYDKIIWTPGEKHSSYYNLSSYYSKLAYNPSLKKLYTFSYDVGNNQRGAEHDVSIERLPDYIGEDMTNRLLAQPLDQNGTHSLERGNLSTPSKGMLEYYGNIFPKRLLTLAQEHDPEAKLSVHSDRDKDVNGFPALQLSPKMRDSILKKGFKAYKTGGYIDDSSILSAAQNPDKAIRKALMVAKRFSKKND